MDKGLVVFMDDGQLSAVYNSTVYRWHSIDDESLSVMNGSITSFHDYYIALQAYSSLCDEFLHRVLEV